MVGIPESSETRKQGKFKPYGVDDKVKDEQ